MSPLCFVAGLLGSVAALPMAAFNLTTDGAAVSAQQAGNLFGRVLGFHGDADLV